MILQMQKYDYTFQYKPGGKEIILETDCPDFLQEKKTSPYTTTHTHINYIQLTNTHLNIIWESIERDLIYHTIYQLILNGWPARYHQVCQIAWKFWGTQDELPIISGLFPKNSQLCIHPELHNRHLETLMMEMSELKKCNTVLDHQ